jgi:hypothetical protein
MHQSSYLLVVLMGMLSPQAFADAPTDPWHGWKVFKEFARAVHEEPDPGISVQVDPVGEREELHLFFVRQVVARKGDELVPSGAVVCEFVFAPRRRRPLEWREWSFEHPSFESFVDAVEQHPVVSELFVTNPLRSQVYVTEA